MWFQSFHRSGYRSRVQRRGAAVLSFTSDILGLVAAVRCSKTRAHLGPPRVEHVHTRTKMSSLTCEMHAHEVVNVFALCVKNVQLAYWSSQQSSRPSVLAVPTLKNT